MTVEIAVTVAELVGWSSETRHGLLVIHLARCNCVYKKRTEANKQKVLQTPLFNLPNYHSLFSFQLKINNF